MRPQLHLFPDLLVIDTPFFLPPSTRWLHHLVVPLHQPQPAHSDGSKVSDGKTPPLVEIDQEVLVFPFFALERGETLKEEPVAYKSWGTLNDQRDGVMIICHAFTGSSDVEDWCVLLYPPLFFIFLAPSPLLSHYFLLHGTRLKPAISLPHRMGFGR